MGRDARTISAGDGAAHGSSQPRRRSLLALGALGVVYGDIGTSPLYAMREAFVGPRAAPLDADGVLGVTSLIVWSLTIVVSVKYLAVVMRADDHGEGGIIALQNLAIRAGRRSVRVLAALGAMGLFGTALLYGDGMITPAISVLAAVEGLEVVTTSLRPAVVPISIVVLVALFAVQPRGTGRIGRLFGPVMLVWFGFLAATGTWQLVSEPAVLRALDPTRGLSHLFTPGGLFTLGAVFLAVTGSEALYADMGHFGRRPITICWTAVVFPALLLQYLGQGALLLASPSSAETVFYEMAPAGFRPVTVLLATVATVIASQALISGAFSLTAQAIQLDLLPRMRVLHTSDREFGQVYVPAVNWGLLVAAILLVVGFRSSTRLASAYGVAVVLTMIVTTILFYVVAVDHFGWPASRAGALCAGFAVVDVVFLAANVDKVPSGGWFPLVVGGVIHLTMTTWRRGRELVFRATGDGRLGIGTLLEQLASDGAQRVAGTAVYLHATAGQVPPALLTDLRRNHVLHRRIVLVAVQVTRDARVPVARRATVDDLGSGFVQIVLRFGFAEEPDVPAALSGIVDPAYGHQARDTTYVIGDDEVLATPGTGMPLWRERMFVSMLRNTASAANHFRLPADAVVRVGRHVAI